MIRRRDLLKSSLLLPALWSSLPTHGSTRTSGASVAEKFDFAALKGYARAIAEQPYAPPNRLAPRELIDLTYDQYQAIRFRRDQALWSNEERGFRIEFFHMGRGFKEPVRMYEIANGQAREIEYRSSMFRAREGAGPGNRENSAIS